MNKRKTARRLMLHYLELLARAAGVQLDADCRAEIKALVDDIIDAAKDELREEMGLYQKEKAK